MHFVRHASSQSLKSAKSTETTDGELIRTCDSRLSGYRIAAPFISLSIMFKVVTCERNQRPISLKFQIVLHLTSLPSFRDSVNKSKSQS